MSRCMVCGSGMGVYAGRAVCLHDMQHGIALGGPGSGWHAEQGHVPGSQGGTARPVSDREVYFHGTTHAAVAKIRREGIKSADLLAGHETVQGPHVFMSTSIDEAVHYAVQRASASKEPTAPVLLQVKVPASHAAALHHYATGNLAGRPTARGARDTRVSFPDRIPPEWIVKVSEVAPSGIDGWATPKYIDMAEQDKHTMWLVAFVRTGDA